MSDDGEQIDQATKPPRNLWLVVVGFLFVGLCVLGTVVNLLHDPPNIHGHFRLLALTPKLIGGLIGANLIPGIGLACGLITRRAHRSGEVLVVISVFMMLLSTLALLW